MGNGWPPTRSYGVVGKNVNKVFQQICLNIERILSLYRGGLGTESRAVLGNWGGERKRRRVSMATLVLSINGTGVHLPMGGLEGRKWK